MTANLNIVEYDLVSDVQNVTKEVLTEDKKNKTEMLFFGNLDVPMQEIDAAIKKLEQLSRNRFVSISEEI